MAHDLFPRRIETDRLAFEPISHETLDPFEFHEFVTSDDWRGDATEHMPWFRFDRLDQIADFIDHSEERWADRERAQYVLRSKEEKEERAENGQKEEKEKEGDDIVGVTAYVPEWETRRAGSDIVLSKRYWGREYGLERASAFIELTFERYDLDAFYTTCAADNDPSRRMIEKYVEKYGGRHEGLLRHHSSRPGGDVTDQHRFTILRDEYESATEDAETLAFDATW